MKTAVIFRSFTGHSKKIARAVAAALAVEAQNIKSNPELKGVDLLFVVGGIYSGTSLEGMLEYVKSLMPENVKRAALITSSMSDKKGQDEVRSILEANGIEVETEEYRCRGNFLFLKIGRPNKKEIAGAAEFAKRLAENLKAKK